MKKEEEKGEEGEEETVAEEEEEGGGRATWYHLQPKVPAQGQRSGKGNEETGPYGGSRGGGPRARSPYAECCASASTLSQEPGPRQS